MQSLLTLEVLRSEHPGDGPRRTGRPSTRRCPRRAGGGCARARLAGSPASRRAWTARARAAPSPADRTPRRRFAASAGVRGASCGPSAMARRSSAAPRRVPSSSCAERSSSPPSPWRPLAAAAAPAPTPRSSSGSPTRSRRCSRTQRFADLGIQHARVQVPWDVFSHPAQLEELDRWLTAAQAAGVQPLISFGHSRTERRSLPSPSRFKYEFRRFRERYPWVDDVRDLERGEPLRRADVPPPAPRARVLEGAHAGVLELHDPRRRAPGHAEHGELGARVPPLRRPRARHLGAAQLRRRQPLPHDRHAAIAARRDAATCGSPRWAASSTGATARAPGATRCACASRRRTPRARRSGSWRTCCRSARGSSASTSTTGTRRRCATRGTPRSITPGGRARPALRVLQDHVTDGEIEPPSSPCDPARGHLRHAPAARQPPPAGPLRRAAARRGRDPARRRRVLRRDARRAAGARPAAARGARQRRRAGGRRRSCPTELVLELEGVRIAMVHDSGPRRRPDGADARAGSRTRTRWSSGTPTSRCTRPGRTGCSSSTPGARPTAAASRATRWASPRCSARPCRSS